MSTSDESPDDLPHEECGEQFEFAIPEKSLADRMRDAEEQKWQQVQATEKVGAWVKLPIVLITLVALGAAAAGWEFDLLGAYAAALAVMGVVGIGAAFWWPRMFK
jgi:hypothetical protein